MFLHDHTQVSITVRKPWKWHCSWCPPLRCSSVVKLPISPLSLLSHFWEVLRNSGLSQSTSNIPFIYIWMDSQYPILLSGLKFTTVIYFWFWECGSLSSGMALPEFDENPVVFTKCLYLVRNWAPNSVSPEVGAAEIFIWLFQQLAI